MRKTLFALLLAFSSVAYSQSDFNGAWSVSGLAGITHIALDFDLGTEFVFANGVAEDVISGAALPINGSCYYAQNGSVICRFDLPQGNSGSLVILPTLDAAWSTADNFGEVVEVGVLSFLGSL